VTGTDVGDEVEVWFEGGGATSDSFTYEAVNETSNDTLVVASEDYTGASPVQTAGPHYLSRYLDALEANGVTADFYDVDTRGRKAADALGVLSHYRAVIVEKGDDIVTREPGWGGGNASRIAQDEVFELREFMNEGGRGCTRARTPASSTARHSCTTRRRRMAAAATRPSFTAVCS
jgi:hypothetical protein